MSTLADVIIAGCILLGFLLGGATGFTVGVRLTSRAALDRIAEAREEESELATRKALDLFADRAREWWGVEVHGVRTTCPHCGRRFTALMDVTAEYCFCRKCCRRFPAPLAPDSEEMEVPG